MNSLRDMTIARRLADGRALTGLSSSRGRGRHFLWFALWATLVACLPPAHGTPPEPTIVTAGVPPAHVDLAPVVWQPGLSEYALTVPGQGERSVAVWVPNAARPRSIVVFLHGRVVSGRGPRSGTVPRVEPAHQQRRSLPIHDGGRLDGRRQTRGAVPCLVAPGLEALDPLVLAPISPDGEWWKRRDTELVLGLLQAAQRRWPEAGLRSIVTGYSNGGIGTWFFARLYPEYFSAAVPMASNDSIVGPSPLPIYAIHGAHDELFDAQAVGRAVRALERAGQEMTYDEKRRGSHFRPCSYVPELKRAARWLTERLPPPSRPVATP